MAGFSQIFIYLLLVQMFYAFSVSIFVPQIPSIQQQQIVQYTDSRGVISFSTLGNAMESSIGSQTQTPIIELGALIYYSSSIMINLVVNFITAIPQMLTWLLAGLFAFLPFNYTIQVAVKSIFIAMVTIIYYFLLLLYIMGARSGVSLG